MKGKLIVMLLVLLCFSLEILAQNGRGKQKRKKSFEELTTQLLNGEIDSTSYKTETLELGSTISLESVNVQTLSIQTLSPGQVYYVNATASGGDGLSWATAFNSLQNALSAAVSGDEIWVAQGTYKPTTTTTRTIYFNMKTGVSLYGGFAGTESSREERNWELNPTVLSGEIGNSSIVTDNSDHVIYANSVSDIVLDGFVVEKGYSSSNRYGGGMYCSNSINVLVQNCVFEHNVTSYHGGGMYANATSNLNVINCIFRFNRTISYDGGGLFLGGNSTKNVINCLFYENRCGRAGGAMEAAFADCSVINSTFSANETDFFGEGVSSWGGNISIYNSIVYGNGSSQGNLSRPSSGRIYVYSSDIGTSTYTEGENVIDEDPLFEDSGIYNFKVQAESPCIDAGMMDISGITFPQTDLAGNDRIVNEFIDMGAFEYSSIEPAMLYAIASGNWSDGAIWSYTQNGPPCNRVPLSIDAVYVQGYNIVVDNDVSCTFLNISNSTSEASVTVLNNELTVFGEIRIEKEPGENGIATLNVEGGGSVTVLEDEL